MQEFSSVTASSYDADSLTPLLNERAADGWNVVSIVAAGTNIVAYLAREGSGTTATAGSDADSSAIAGADLLGLDVETPADETPEHDETPSYDFTGAETDTDVAAVDEPAGWATAPEETSTDDSIAALATQIDDESVTATETVEAEPAAEPVAEPVLATTEPAVTESEPAAAQPAVPAGWYADPSGRFELRYWDGAAWTEHVSRAGQQFTDPPVA